MILEYARLLGLSGEAPLSFESISKVVLIMLAGVILIFVGYKVKGVLGAAIALLIGVFLLLYRKGLLPL